MIEPESTHPHQAGDWPTGARPRAGRRCACILIAVLFPVAVSPAQDSEEALEAEPTPIIRAEAVPQGLAPSERPGPKPQPVRETSFSPRPGPEAVRVDADGSGFFDADENKATFTDNVRVVHPSFNLTADQLEVFLETNEAGGDSPASEEPALVATASTEDPAVLATESSAETEDMGIRLAIARGRRVLIHRLSDEGELMVGTCRHATFDGRTREMTLRDWPQVQKGANLIRAIEQSAVIILTEDGQIRTEGRVRTELARGDDEEAGRVIAPPAGPNP